MIKKILKIIGILFLLITILVGVLIYNTYSNFKKMSQVELKTDFITDTIPFRYSASGHMLINVKVNNSTNSYNFILDSGASNYIFEKFQQEQYLKNNGYQIGKSSSGNLFFTKIKTIDSIQIGNLKFTNIQAQEKGFTHNCSDNIYGIIGKETMRNLVWHIDFKNQRIILSKKLSDLQLKEDKIEIPLTENIYSHHIYTTLQFRKNSISTSVIVDLGSSGTLSLNENDILKNSINFETKKIHGIGSVGLANADKKESNHKFYMIDSLYFKKNNYAVTNVQVMASPTSINMLGLGFFKKYRTTISWEDKKLILEPYDTVQKFIYKTGGFNTEYDTSKNKVFIKSIYENSAASIAKLTLNSEVISINNQVFKNMNDYCTYKKNSKTSGDSIRVQIRDTTIKEYLLIKKYLFN